MNGGSPLVCMEKGNIDLSIHTAVAAKSSLTFWLLVLVYFAFPSQSCDLSTYLKVQHVI